ncbi:hypothetical protein [uncultured Sneathia sp.]|uniref:hypothetical protein n=1 Tax=uncultured Sneathia sp. TaxID=278067 RepID=UPI0025934CA8|nr:hypothetical protein [uncultured Sneathia sp.]
MNDYELEYFVATEELKHRYIDSETLKKVRKVRSRILRNALLIYIVLLAIIVFILFHVLIRIPNETVSLILGIIVLILIIALQRPCVDKMYRFLMKRKYKKHLSKEFVERLKNEHKYYED